MATLLPKARRGPSVIHEMNKLKKEDRLKKEKENKIETIVMESVVICIKNNKY